MGGKEILYINLKFFNNEVFECGPDERLEEIVKYAVTRNTQVEEDKACVATLWVPDYWYKMSDGERNDYIDFWARVKGLEVLLDECGDNEFVVWKCNDGTWKKERVKH